MEQPTRMQALQNWREMSEYEKKELHAFFAPSGMSRKAFEASTVQIWRAICDKVRQEK